MNIGTSAKANSLMVMGTASDVGKSVIVTGVCRLFARCGVRVAPFKSQNMSNNAAVCQRGGEIGRAQAVQAEACGLEPTVDMNPVLLKPDSEKSCQVVINGRARFGMSAHDHRQYRQAAWPEIVKSYERLAAQFELIVIEGAGGAAEVNLRDRDLVNWRIAELADAPVVIVADIDKGGALAALVGTVGLLSPVERDRVKGLLINKFRGDAGLLINGLRIVEERTGVPVLGVLPYIENFEIPQEDSASLRIGAGFRDQRPIRIGVVRLPRISNYTDFDRLTHEPDVELQYLDKPADAQGADIVCLPGTKNTIADLEWLRASGWDRRIFTHHRTGGLILGICGGYQILGRVIADPDHVESSTAEVLGLGLLQIETVFAPQKITALVNGIETSSGMEISGYEIHCGRVVGLDHGAPFRIHRRDGQSVNESEGARSADGRVLGTSIHGLLDAPAFRRHYLNQARARKGLDALAISSEDTKALRLRAYDSLADLIARNMDVSLLEALVGLSRSNASARW
jgi:adenosylcobyric acid synthase